LAKISLASSRRRGEAGGEITDDDGDTTDVDDRL
jgi:hypothetical protein